MSPLSESGSALTEPQSRERIPDGRKSSDWEVDYDGWRAHILNRYAIPMGPRTIRILHGRLHCGVKLFDKHENISVDAPACSVMAVCQTLVAMHKAGDLHSAITTAETSFANNGLNDRRSHKPHAACQSCVQTFCPVWQLVHGKAEAGKAVRR